MKQQLCILSLSILLAVPELLASPLRLTIQPLGTNQVQLVLEPVKPDAFYQVLARTNGPEGHWINFTSLRSGTNRAISMNCNLGGIEGLTLQTLSHWKFAAGEWNDTLGDEMPPLAKELIFRIDPYAAGDPYGNLMGDGWSNVQKLQNNMNPFEWYVPAKPVLDVKFHDAPGHDIRHGTAALTWEVQNGTVPDLFLVSKAIRTLRPITNNPYYQSQMAGRYSSALGTNRPPFNPRFGPYATNRPPLGFRFPPSGTNYPPPGARFAPFGTNRPPDFRPMNVRPDWRREDPLVTGPYEIVARVPGRPDLRSYRFFETNVDTLFQPLYRVQAHYSPPLRPRLSRVDTEAIRQTILPVKATPTTNGFALEIAHPIPSGWYLLLVRDRNNAQWRASGYFTAGTNRNPVYLKVDQKGMMADGQSPIAMPQVRFLPDVVNPEFTAGWGEDSDGDGLPDIYEVLVTKTQPDNADTGDTGTLDGFKEMTGDGWNNLEKFRRRIDPLQPARLPTTIELIQPTGAEIMSAITPKTDLACELQIAVRTNGASTFQPLEQVPWVLPQLANFRQAHERKNFDLRIGWRFAEPAFNQYVDGPFGREAVSFQALESLMMKIEVQTAETMKARLAAGPPLTPIEASNETAAIFNSYRQGGLDKGVVMAEIMALQDNQAQDFYGKVVDQYGQPVAGADIAMQINLEMGGGSSQKAVTDSEGLFQFTGIRGHALNLTPRKSGYQIEGHGLGLKGLNGPETSLTNRAVYTMWKLRGPEPLSHRDIIDRKMVADGRTFTIDFVKGEITEGTNMVGDALVQIQRPPVIKPRQAFDWSFVLTAIDGGFIEVTNDDYLFAAPLSGYQPRYEMNRFATNAMNYSRYPLYRTDRTFFFKTRGGQVYGHFHINELDPAFRGGMAALHIESFANPAGSTNLEFDPAKQIQ